MDERHVLIVTDKGDVTKNIIDYTTVENKVLIRFNNKDECYNFPASKVNIMTNPVSLAIDRQTVFYKGLPLRNVQEALDFGGILKIFFKNQTTQIYETELINIKETNPADKWVTNLMNYWEDIAQYVKSEEESAGYSKKRSRLDQQDTFLKKQFSRLNSIHADSVLASYVNQTPITPLGTGTAPVIYPFRFNLSQKKALEQALISKICVIEGPPGTGKTQTILNILANLTAMQNKSVAVVSGNNAAVRNVKDKLDKDGYGFIAASLGNMENREAFFNNLPDYQVADWNSDIPIETHIKTINDLSRRLDELLLLANRKAKLDQEISAYRLEKKHFQLHNQQFDYDGMERLFYRRQTPETVISFLADEYFSGIHSFRFLRKAKLLFKYGFYQFKKLKKNRLELITRLQMKYYESKLAELELESHEIKLELDRESFDDLMKQHETSSTVLFKHHLFRKYRSKKTYNGNLKNYKHNFDAFIDHFPILLSTTHSLRSCIPDNFLFDYVIIDEASQVDLLTGVLAMSCCKQVIIVGDTKQLPQIVDEKIQGKLTVTDVSEAYNYFNHSVLTSVLSIYEENIPKVRLKEHYRCRPRIIEFCNHQYYDNELIPFTSEEESDISIRLHYTSAGNHMRRVTLEGKQGSFNHREIEAFREEILQELQLQNIPNEDIGFTTPYRLQVTEANLILDDNIEMDTVHKYQGREKPVMVLSTVLDQTRNGQIGKKFVENPQLVNVAVSRAQKQFILVTDHQLFRTSRKDIGNLIRYIEYNTLHEHITQSELVSVFDLLYSEYSEKLNDLQNRLFTKFRYKSENIIWRVLSDLIEEDKYKCVIFGTQVYLKDLIRETGHLSESETTYIKHRASFDFVFYDAINKQPLLALEVDGFASHRNNPDQLERDKKKDSICKKIQLPLLRLPTTGSNEIEKIRRNLDMILYSQADI
ncbi:AAA domain-containing protein [Cohnella boryungensis]|uniref:AAA domain-containing protein n=1 Tax=Cohnella boryungensis TaxID=768479 RepID=A0ABV8SED9_9BACL